MTQENLHHGILFLTRANPQRTRVNSTTRHSIRRGQKVTTVDFAFEEVHLKDIVWCEPYRLPNNSRLPTGCLCLLESGIFRAYRQSADFVRRRACAIVGKWAKQGLPFSDIPDIPWALELEKNHEPSSN